MIKKVAELVVEKPDDDGPNVTNIVPIVGVPSSRILPSQPTQANYHTHPIQHCHGFIHNDSTSKPQQQKVLSYQVQQNTDTTNTDSADTEAAIIIEPIPMTISEKYLSKSHPSRKQMPPKPKVTELCLQAPEISDDPSTDVLPGDDVIPLPAFALNKAAVERERELQRDPNDMAVVEDSEEFRAITSVNTITHDDETSAMENHSKNSDLIEAAFEEMVDHQPKERWSRPLVVLDGANIGWHHGHHEYFSAHGLKVAIDTLQKRYQVDVVAFLPASYFQQQQHRASVYRKRKQQDTANYQTDSIDYGGNNTTNTFHDIEKDNSHQSDHNNDNGIEETNESNDQIIWEALQSLLRAGTLVSVPAGDHDDAYILHYARAQQGFIVSNDQYRDHLQTLAASVCSSIAWSMHLWLQENRCGFTFVQQDELVLNPTSTFALTLLQQKQLKQRKADDGRHNRKNNNDNDNDNGDDGSSSVVMDTDEQQDTAGVTAAVLPAIEWMQLTAALSNNNGNGSNNIDDAKHMDTSNLQNNNNNNNNGNMVLLQSLTQSACVCYSQRRPQALKHVLFARIFSLLQEGRITEAQNDVWFIRQYLVHDIDASNDAELSHYEQLIAEYIANNNNPTINTSVHSHGNYSISTNSNSDANHSNTSEQQQQRVEFMCDDDDL